tara:strand:+ start:160 stop:630 length:471 start_codon:yes stop_codon:yes gene_type:complete
MIKLMITASVVLTSSVVWANGLTASMHTSASGMHAQSERMKIVAQNIANADSTGATPGAEPYRRKTIAFRNEYDPATGAYVVKVDNTGEDYNTPFAKRYDPGHPAANREGYVLRPNVKTTVETVDMKEAERTYEANLGMMKTTKGMYISTIDLLRR